MKWRHDNGVAATISNLSVTDADGIASAMLQSTQMEATAINVSASLDGVTQLNADKTVSFNTPLVNLSGVSSRSNRNGEVPGRCSFPALW